MALETLTVPKYSHEQLLAMMNEAEGAPAQIVTPDEKPKVWSQTEIKQLRESGKLTDELMDELKKATLEGRVI
jgi:hypothetical protein